MKEEFWTVVCERSPHLRILLVILSVLLILTVFSVLYTPTGTASHIVAVVDLVLILLAIAATVFLLWRCRINEKRRGEWRPEKRREQ